MPLGTTKLAAVNHILSVVPILPVGALDSTGTWPSKTYGITDAALAERYLDDVLLQIQLEGCKGCVTFKDYTLGSPGTITLDSNVIRAMPVGKYENRRWDIRDDKMYDLEANTSTFPAGTYSFKIHVALSFEDSPPEVKNLAMTRAAELFQSVRRNDPSMAAYTEKQAVRAATALSNGEYRVPEAPMVNATLATAGLGQQRSNGQ